MTIRTLTAVITRDGEWYVALCPELDIASEGSSVEEARLDLAEALTHFFEEASAEEIERRSGGEVDVTSVEVGVAGLGVLRLEEGRVEP